MASQGDSSQAPPPAQSSTPTTDKADKDKKTLTPAKGSEDTETTQRCKHCGKQVDRVGFSTHSKQCLRQKKEARVKKAEAEAREAVVKAAKERGEEPPPEKDAEAEADDSFLSNVDAAPEAPEKKKTGLKLDLGKNKKKRKAEDDAVSVTSSVAKDKPPTKKQKKKSESASNAPGTAAKTATGGGGGGGGGGSKPKGPVDVERQCGVLLPNGANCARSLTCKSHSMGAKRSVPGRSLPYDTLLQRYQKKNQAKQQKAAIAAQGQQLPEDLALDGLAPDGSGAKVDSDEETGAVMEGVRRALAAPQPLFERPATSFRSRAHHVRLKEQISNALGGSRGAGLFATSYQIQAREAEEQQQAAQPNGAQSSANSRRGSTVMGQPANVPQRRQLSLSLGSLDATKKRAEGSAA